MSAQRSSDIFETFDRFNVGRKVREDSWDYSVVPTNAMLMKEKYNVEFGTDIISTDPDLLDRLFAAGIEMLATTGFYNTDSGRVLTLNEEEIYSGIKKSPKSVKIGNGNQQIVCSGRRGNSRKKPIIQGGPTGAPVSEEIFGSLIQSYAQEPVVDTLVSGVMSTVNGHAPSPGTPWEIRATMAEIRQIRQATAMSCRPGLGI